MRWKATSGLATAVPWIGASRWATGIASIAAAIWLANKGVTVAMVMIRRFWWSEVWDSHHSDYVTMTMMARNTGLGGHSRHILIFNAQGAPSTSVTMALTMISNVALPQWPR